MLSQTVEYGGLVTEPADPTRVGFIFQGWFTDDGTFLDAWDFANDVVTEDLTLYALWTAQRLFLMETAEEQPAEAQKYCQDQKN